MNKLLLLANEVSDNVPVPVFDKVTVCTLLVRPTVVGPKLSVVGAALAAGAVATPVPLSATVVVAWFALWLKLSVPEAAPAAVGAKLTLTLQLPLTATVPPVAQVTPVTLNAGLLVANEASVKAAVPVFDKLTVCAALVLPT